MSTDPQGITPKLMIFTPTWKTANGYDAIWPECAASIKAQKISIGVEWVVGHNNPYKVPDHRNVLVQYQAARAQCLEGDFSALLTVEHDMVLPDDGAVQRMLDTEAQIVYGVYMLRGMYILNAWQYAGDKKLGESLTLHPGELKRARDVGVWRVCGAGNGCTLFRRETLERLPFRGGGNGLQWCPDLPFAEDALHAGIVSLARFDVALTHLEKHERIEPYADIGSQTERWRVASWKGHPQWKCKACPFDTLSGERVMRQHWRARHATRA